MKASDVKDLLAVRHSKDLFVTECKTGSSGAGMQSFDAWAMKRSYSKPLISGYEIKVSRGDFLNDNKWQGYLPYCNEFYFVTPYEMVHPSELPVHAGLMWVSKEGRRVRIKRKAAWRPTEHDKLLNLFKYIIMTRTEIIASDFSAEGRKRLNENRLNGGVTPQQYWEGWLKDKKLDFHFGRRIQGEIKQRLDEEVNNVKSENTRLKEQIAGYDKIISMCEKLDIDPVDWNLENQFRKKVAGISRKLLMTVDRVKGDLDELEEELEKVK